MSKRCCRHPIRQTGQFGYSSRNDGRRGVGTPRQRFEEGKRRPKATPLLTPTKSGKSFIWRLRTTARAAIGLPPTETSQYPHPSPSTWLPRPWDAMVDKIIRNRKQCPPHRQVRYGAGDRTTHACTENTRTHRNARGQRRPSPPAPPRPHPTRQRQRQPVPAVGSHGDVPRRRARHHMSVAGTCGNSGRQGATFHVPTGRALHRPARRPPPHRTHRGVSSPLSALHATPLPHAPRAIILSGLRSPAEEGNPTEAARSTAD
jgi:hypothetical protein